MTPWRTKLQHCTAGATRRPIGPHVGVLALAFGVAGGPLAWAVHLA